MFYADSHIHITQIPDWKPVIESDITNNAVQISPVCACAHSPTEWTELAHMARGKQNHIICAFGIHPQNPDTTFIQHLDSVLKGNDFCENKPDAIGEAGFDLFSSDYTFRINEQTEVWNAQTEFAQKYNLPLIIHCRRALHLIFADSKKLSRVPSVIFHSFAGSPQEARSLVKRGINARFSFGKPLLNGNKRALHCVKEIPPELLLAETDAPFQRLKNETCTKSEDIKKIYAKISEIRAVSTEYICEQLYCNFQNAFGKTTRLS